MQADSAANAKKTRERGYTEITCTECASHITTSPSKNVVCVEVAEEVGRVVEVMEAVIIIVAMALSASICIPPL